jgi:Ca-activated chloride channel family protein
VIINTDDAIRFCLPTTVAPRYAPAGTDPVSADRSSPPYALQKPYGLSLDIEIAEPEGLSNVLSPSHKIIVSKELNQWVITLRDGDTCLDRDFILEINLKAAKDSVALVQEHENGDRAIMVRFYPEFDHPEERAPSEVIFLLDCSGSMAGSSIEQAKNVLELCLRSMSMGDHFNVICFGSEFKAMLKQPVKYDEKSFRRALEYVRHIDANLGGTEILPALKFIYEMPASSKGCKREIFILTDGEVFNEEEIMRLVQENRKNARIFSFGIGYGPSESLVRGLAREAGGMAEFISPEERIEEKVLRQFSRMDTPYVKDLTIDWQGLKINQAPSQIPPVFSGDSFSVFGLVSSSKIPSNIVLSGKIGEEEISWSAPMKQITKGDLIATIWARNYIRDLERDFNLGRGSQQSQRKSEKTHKEMIRIGIRYHLMSSVTSFVAVETRDDTEKSKEAPVYRRVPVQITKGWHGYTSFTVARLASDLTRECNKCSYVDALEYSSENATRIMPSFMTRVTREVPRAPEVLGLLHTQNAAGYFEITDLLAWRSGIPIAEIRDLASQITGIKSAINPEHVISSIMVLYLLKNKYRQSAKIWGKAARKAQDWLNKEAPNALLNGTNIAKELDRVIRSILKD